MRALRKMTRAVEMLLFVCVGAVVVGSGALVGNLIRGRSFVASLRDAWPWSTWSNAVGYVAGGLVFAVVLMSLSRRIERRRNRGQDRISS